MKIDARQLRFLPVGWWFTRRELRFVGKMNTIQLLETALVIEGLRKTISYPIIDLFFQQALSDWTMVTIPYSRIVRCRYSRRWFMRAIFVLGLAALTALMILPVFAMSKSEWIYLVLFVPYSIALAGLAIYGWFGVLPARYSLLYRRADGKKELTRFRIKSWKLRQQFNERLEANRKSAASHAGGSEWNN